MLHSLYNICDCKKTLVLLPAVVFMNYMIFGLKQSFGPLSQAEGRLVFAQREICSLPVSFRKKNKMNLNVSLRV